MKKSLSIITVERLIETPSKDWIGDCYGVAVKMVDRGVIEGKAVYGHWLGQIAPNSLFACCRRLGFARHGWVEYKNKIVDPTRWVFESVKPYIYIGKNNGLYDKGGNVWRMANLRPPPEYDEKSKKVKLKLNKSASLLVHNLLNGPKETTIEHMFWLANLSPETFGKYVKEIFQSLVNVGYEALIPIDNRRAILND